MAKPHYNEANYRAARAWLTAHPNTTCWYDGCTERATTIDHVPAIIEHHHRRGTHCCRLLPACTPHNCGHGATLGNRKRNQRRRSVSASTPEPRTLTWR